MTNVEIGIRLHQISKQLQGDLPLEERRALLTEKFALVGQEVYHAAIPSRANHHTFKINRRDEADA